jgi:GNAT superfamily N-acetyltransferase
MHRIRMSVRENVLSDPDSVRESSHDVYIEAGTAWVAERRGEIAGFGTLDAPARSVWALFVDPAAEGLGIGRELLARMVEQAQSRGLERLSLSTEPNSRAATFYRRQGWVEAGLTDKGELLFERILKA